MQTMIARESDTTRAAYRRRALELLIDGLEPVDEADLQDMLNGILDNFAAPEGRMHAYLRAAYWGDQLYKVSNGLMDVYDGDNAGYQATCEDELNKALDWAAADPRTEATITYAPMEAA